MNAKTERLLCFHLLPGQVVCLMFAFVLLVPAAQAGYLDLTWEAPTTNVDGTALMDLAGYRVYFGTVGLPCQGASFLEVPSERADPAAGDTVAFRLGGLETGTSYSVQVTAIDAGGIESSCSNEATGIAKDENSPSGGAGDGGGGCFIATAAFGSALDPRVVLLRSFRDQYLVSNAAGRAFVRWYYRVSPPLAGKIRGSPPLRWLTREMLWPFVGAVWMIFHPSVSISFLLGGLGLAGWLRFRTRLGR